MLWVGEFNWVKGFEVFLEMRGCGDSVANGDGMVE